MCVMWRRWTIFHIHLVLRSLLVILIFYENVCVYLWAPNFWPAERKYVCIIVGLGVLIVSWKWKQHLYCTTTRDHEESSHGMAWPWPWHWLMNCVMQSEFKGYRHQMITIYFFSFFFPKYSFKTERHGERETERETSICRMVNAQCAMLV